MMFLFSMLQEVHIEFTFGIWVKMMQLTLWIMLVWLKKWVFYKIFFIIYKINSTTYYQKNRDVLLTRAKGYYKRDKERLREKARDKYRNLSEEDINKRKEYEKYRYHMPVEKKQKNKENIKKNVEKK